MTTTPDCLERRCGQRFEVQVPVSIRLMGSKHESSGFTQDLSARGCFLYTDFPLGAGEAIEVTLLMPSVITLGESMRVRCQGKVLRVLQPSVGTRLGVAVHFAGYEYLAEPAVEDHSDFNRISALHERSEEAPLRVSSSQRAVS